MNAITAMLLGRLQASPWPFRVLRRRLLSSKLIFSSAPLLAANATEAFAALLRNIILAHAISPHDFGLALFLIVLITILEVLTDFGLPIYAVRTTIDLPETLVMATLQSLAIIRASMIALALISLAPLVARHFGSPYPLDVYVVLALVALARGFENLGVKAMMREFRYFREAITIVVSQLVGLGVTVLSVSRDHSFTCVLWGLGASAACTILFSHALSPTPFRLGWNKGAARDASRFGRPLLANGLAVAISVSDRVFIATFLSPAALALYTIAMGTAQSPRWFAVKFLTSAFVPAFVRTRRSADQSRSLAEMWIWLISAIAAGYGLCLIAMGRDAVAIVFGGIYTPSQDFISLTAILIAVSFLLHIPVPPSYADGDTKVVMCGSIFYASAIVTALVALIATKSLMCFMVTVTVANTAGLLLLLRVFVRRTAHPPHSLWLPISLPLALLSSLGLLPIACPNLTRVSWLTICGTGACAAAFVYVPKLLKLASVQQTRSAGVEST